MTIDSVEVLLAVYRQANFVESQVQSILAQTGAEVRILVRDDGSDDGAADIVARLCSEHPDRMTHIDPHTPNLGVVANFSRLMQQCTASYVCFSDGDDLWLPGKVDRSLRLMKQLESLHGPATPLLVHTDLKVVAEDLTVIADSFWRHQRLDARRGKELPRLLPFNCVTGSTVMMNRALVEAACPLPKIALMHDWWVALVAASLGVVAELDEPTVLYRQHAKNALGSQGISPWYVLTRLASSLPGGSVRLMVRRSMDQARELLVRHGSRMPADRAHLVRAWATMNDHSPLKRRWILRRFGFTIPGLARKIGLLVNL